MLFLTFICQRQRRNNDDDDDKDKKVKLECGSIPNGMAALPNIGGALCSTLQSMADSHY